MAFPNEFYGREGQQFNEYVDERYPLGTLMKFKDGRKFRFCKLGSTVAVAGNLYQMAAVVSNHQVMAVQAAAAAGATSIPVTLGATAVTADQYKDGFLVIENATGQGHTYKVASHAAVASAGTFTVPLLDQTVKVAVDTTSEASLFINPYSGLIIHGSPPTNAVIGVSVHAVTASYYAWFQTAGLGCCLADGAITAGQMCRASDGTDGAIEAIDATSATTLERPIVGRCIRDAGSTDYDTIWLTIE